MIISMKTCLHEFSLCLPVGVLSWSFKTDVWTNENHVVTHYFTNGAFGCPLAPARALRIPQKGEQETATNGGMAEMELSMTKDRCITGLKLETKVINNSRYAS